MSEALTTTTKAPDTRIAPAIPRSARPLIYAEALVEEGQQRQLLMRYVGAHMVEGTDFGIIPGTKNKTLLKPGAEKLCDLFRCVPEFEIVERTEDFDRPLFHYLIRCKVISRESGVVVAEGLGSCNSRESRYRWRNGDRKCPQCGAAAIMRSKYPPRDYPEDPPGWYCYAKKNGCGANFNHDDDAIVSQPQGKVENPDVADQANTILKMAKKRAQVDATLALVRCSDMFTQDAEDFVDAEPVVTAPTPTKTSVQPGSRHVELPHPDMIDAAAEDPEHFKAALESSLFKWPGIIKAVNNQFGTGYTNKSHLNDIDPDHRRWMARTILENPK